MTDLSRRLLAPEVASDVGEEKPLRERREWQHDRALFLWTAGPLVLGLVLLLLARVALAGCR